MWNAHMRFSRFELRGRLKTEKLFQTAFLSTSRHSNQTKATRRHPHISNTEGDILQILQIFYLQNRVGYGMKRTLFVRWIHLVG